MSFCIRTATTADLQPIYEMAKLTGGGFTNLPADRTSLASKLEKAAASFASDATEPQDDLFILVLEDCDNKQVVGTCQLFGKVGSSWPFYSYRLSSYTQSSKELDRTFSARILSLTTDLEGASEVGGLFLHPGQRAGGLGMLLARSRYLFIARHRRRFDDRVLAELRGVIDEAGGSPFWDGVAGKFFGMSFQEADEFNAIHGNQFIADLMPKHPIYVAMLSEAARSVMGVPHTSGRAAMRMLETEGFAYENYIDIFDGGPTMIARTDQIKSVRNAEEAWVSGIAKGDTRAMVSVGKLADFRCCYADIGITDQGITLSRQAADQLRIEPGASVLWVAR
ncbi:arginine N-succinyltransferase [Sphingorhabdus soli]|uniref:Arginine N-succinyltransferase n=1 Tax=Flavisphingopyxis soli TaxID=2601267 RepID=A0A5C6ULM6_9SPHN|nr:arginine N-succinyltransferase [Sphingorhabdus soli]TXC74172.1 arginine N-succinyltransferase [Sphingorhabdus soli]